MKTYYMHLNEQPFRMIKNGKKTIELRLNDEKRRGISIGDNIVFSSTLVNSNKLTVKVLKIHKFRTFRELYEVLPLDKCGYEKENLAKASYVDMEDYYPRKEQEKYGVIGIEIVLLDNK